MAICPYCGAPTRAEAAVCTYCGRDQPRTHAEVAAAVSSTLETAIHRYMSQGFNLVTSSKANAVMEKPGRYNSLIFILLLLFFWPAAIVYILAVPRKAVRAQISINAKGDVEESGETIAVLERRRRQTQKTVLLAIGVLLAVAAGLWFIVSLLAFVVTPTRPTPVAEALGNFALSAGLFCLPGFGVAYYLIRRGRRIQV